MPLMIKTALIARLRALAGQLARGEDAPRWVFLVGGPGNGKSEAVQDFIVALDRELGLAGVLESVARARFQPNPLVPCFVDLGGVDVGAVPFEERIKRLIVVQDASASEQPQTDAAAELVFRLVDLLTGDSPDGVLVCCINRGLLARALAVSYREGWSEEELVELFNTLISATALGSEALREDRPPCWPLGLPSGHPLSGKVACWPLDMESLLLDGDDGISPVEQALAHATESTRWEAPGRCLDCDARDLCPFRQNATWLRAGPTRHQLRKLLRRTELATGQRWNFRNSFSLIAELLVGEWDDTAETSSPCAWVHTQVTACRADPSSPLAVSPATLLFARLYPNALFPNRVVGSLGQEERATASSNGCERTLALDDAVAASRRLSATHIRGFLADSLCPTLDPALHSPRAPLDPVGRLEDAYSQSVALGNASWPAEAAMSEIERMFLRLVDQAEGEWNPLSRESAQVLASLRFLRRTTACFAKRSIGARLGMHRTSEYLADYELAIRDADTLNDLRDALRSLLGKDGRFRFNAVESFGQPQAEEQWLVVLEEDTVEIEPIVPAPEATPERPAHDLPCIRISGHDVPVTFELYAALRLRGDGCAASSLPASVRAAIDRIRHLYAGSLCRAARKFVLGRGKYLVGAGRQLTLARETSPPTLRDRR
jgi:hypothetical protein